MNRRTSVVLLALLGLAAAGAWLWHSRVQEPAPPQPAALPAPVASAPQPAASEPAVDAAALQAPADPLAPEQVPAALEALLGGKAVATYLQPNDFARRVVATVDNLGRPHAPPAVWPVHPTPGQFTVDATGGTSAATADNAGRYTPLVLLAETVDSGKAAELYLRLYPLLQHEYRQLGFPDRQFNDRLMEVIALLLATPEPAQPPRLELTEVKGPIPSLRPWVRWQYADPALEGLAAGQKILLRVGLVNERRMKRKLAEFRQEVLRLAPRR